MVNKKLIYFFLGNFIFAGIFLLNFSFKDDNNGKSVFNPIIVWWNEANSIKVENVVLNENKTTETLTLANTDIVDNLSNSTPIEKEKTILKPTIDLSSNNNSQKENNLALVQKTNITEHVTLDDSNRNSIFIRNEKLEPIMISNASLEYPLFNETTKDLISNLAFNDNDGINSSNMSILNDEDKDINNTEKSSYDLDNIEVLESSIKTEEKTSAVITDKVTNEKDNLVLKNIPVAFPLCVNYGPLSIEQKASFDLVISKHNIDPSLFKQLEDDLYEIYWNLGENPEKAVELFERQKNDGALKDAKFKLKKDDKGNYIVPISTVAGNLDMAHKMTSELKNSSSQIGGTWEYRAIDKGYFYQFPDIKKVDIKAIDTINQVIDTLKTTCN